MSERERERESGTASATARKDSQKRVIASQTGTIYDLGKDSNQSAWTHKFEIVIFSDHVWLKLHAEGQTLAELDVPRSDFEAVLKALGYIVPEVESRVVTA